MNLKNGRPGYRIGAAIGDYYPKMIRKIRLLLECETETDQHVGSCKRVALLIVAPHFVKIVEAAETTLVREVEVPTAIPYADTGLDTCIEAVVVTFVIRVLQIADTVAIFSLSKLL